MARTNREHDKRHIVANISPLSINYIHLRNPWVPAWWSAACPGLGHIMLCKYLVAFVLFGWEVLINHMSSLNLAIYYSMIGDFTLAKSTINPEWFLLYIPAYIFAIWDSYHRTEQMNKDFILSYQFGYKILSSNISTLEVNKLEVRKPLNIIIWAFLAPGFGYLHINRLPSGFIFVAWFVTIIYFSHLLPAIHYTMYGDFQAASNIIDPQWFLYLPSLYGFVLYDSYTNCVEYNKLFEKEQARFLKDEYQDKHFVMPI